VSIKSQKRLSGMLWRLIPVFGLVLLACGLASGVSEEAFTDEPEASATRTRPTATLASTPTSEPVNAPAPALPPVVTSPAGQEGAAFDKWSLWAGGTQLRGANIYQRQVFPKLDGTEFLGPGPFGPPYTQQDFDHLAALGADYVNLSIAGVYTVEPPYKVDPQAVENLDRLLEMAAKAQLFAVITFRSGPGRSEFSILRDGAGDWFAKSYLVESVWTEPAAQAAWAAMWRFTAERYLGNPVVVGYDLMCEPNSNAILDVWDPQEFVDEYGDTGYDWNAWYPSIVDAIRSVDADTPILVSSLSYGDIEWLPYLQPVKDERVVYTFHQYSPHEYTHQEPGSGKKYTYPGKFDTNYDGIIEPFDLPWLDNLLSIATDWMAENNRLLAVNEFGAVRWAPGGANYLRDEMDLFEKNGWNYAIWMWYPQWKPMAEGDNSFNFRLGPDAKNLSDVASSDFLDVLTDFWARNMIRP
jgi:hypothetical protein